MTELTSSEKTAPTADVPVVPTEQPAEKMEQSTETSKVTETTKSEETSEATKEEESKSNAKIFNLTKEVEVCC